MDYISNDCTITNTTDDKDEFHPVYDYMIGKERAAKAIAFDPYKSFWATDGRCEGCGYYLERKYNYCPNCGARLEWK